MSKGALSVDTEHLFPIIKKWLYSEKDIFLREIVSNACDAITKLRMVDYKLAEGAKLTDATLRHDAYELLKRPGVQLWKILDLMKEEYDPEIARQVEIEIKYEGYILKARKEADRMRKMDNIALPEDIDYLNVDNLALEARQKLDKIRPASLGQASRISGINPSDIQVLAIYLKQKQR